MTDRQELHSKSVSGEEREVIADYLNMIERSVSNLSLHAIEPRAAATPQVEIAPAASAEATDPVLIAEHIRQEIAKQFEGDYELAA